MWNLGLTLLDVEEVDAALAMLRRCLDNRRKILGDQHKNTIATAEFLMRVEHESESGEARSTTTLSYQGPLCL